MFTEKNVLPALNGYAQTSDRELQFAIPERLSELLQEVLFPDNRADVERGVIGLVSTSTGCSRTTVLLRGLLVPRPDEVTWSEAGLEYSVGYKSRACDQAAADGLGLIFIHTHPLSRRNGVAPGPSRQDMEADARDLYFLGQTLTDGAPLVAGILGANGLWSVRTYQFHFPSTSVETATNRFGPDSGIVTFASAVRIVGTRIRKLPTAVQLPGPGASGALDGQAQDSSILLWGRVGQQALANVRVGLVGAGGVGSILSEHLSRLGVGEMVVLDYDRQSKQNLNRQQGVTREAAANGEPKVRTAERVASQSSTAPDFRVRAVEGSIVEDEGVSQMLDCDIILNATDTDWARQVLDDLSYAHLIPVISGGTKLVGNPETSSLIAGKSEVCCSGHGFPSLEAAGTYTKEGVAICQEHPELRAERGYVEHGEIEQPQRGPSVISNNALVAALMQLRLQAIALGTTPLTARGTQRYHMLEGILEWDESVDESGNDPREAIVGLGDKYQLPTGVDLDFRLARSRWEIDSATPDSRPAWYRRLWMRIQGRVTKTPKMIAGESRPSALLLARRFGRCLQSIHMFF